MTSHESEITQTVTDALKDHVGIDWADDEYYCLGCLEGMGRAVGAETRWAEHAAEVVVKALSERDRRIQTELRADAEARSIREACAALDDLDYIDCTCGHPNDDHNLGECPFPGCGCGLTIPPASTSAGEA